MVTNPILQCHCTDACACWWTSHAVDSIASNTAQRTARTFSKKDTVYLLNATTLLSMLRFGTFLSLWYDKFMIFTKALFIIIISHLTLYNVNSWHRVVKHRTFRIQYIKRLTCRCINGTATPNAVINEDGWEGKRDRAGRTWISLQSDPVT